MSLIGFHKVLIASAALFCGLFAGWNVVGYARGAGTPTLLVALAFAAAGGALLVYLSRLDQVLGRGPGR